jgi:hypothetical protein
LFDSGNGVVRGFSFQKVPNCNWHGPRSHINRVGPIKTTDQVPVEIIQIGIDDGGNLRPSFVVAKNLAVANYSDNLAGLRIDNIALEHVFLFWVSDVTFTTPNSARCSGSVDEPEPILPSMYSNAVPEMVIPPGSQIPSSLAAESVRHFIQGGHSR